MGPMEVSRWKLIWLRNRTELKILTVREILRLGSKSFFIMHLLYAVHRSSQYRTFWEGYKDIYSRTTRCVHVLTTMLGIVKKIQYKVNDQSPEWINKTQHESDNGRYTLPSLPITSPHIALIKYTFEHVLSGSELYNCRHSPAPAPPPRQTHINWSLGMSLRFLLTWPISLPFW